MGNIFLAKGAFHGDPDFKAEAEVSMKEHRAQDRILRANYLVHLDTFGNWDYGHTMVDSVSDESYASLDFKGCALGCMLHNYLDVKSVRKLLRDGGWHKMTQKVFGIPELLACAIDDFFENRLTFEDAAEAAVAIVEAIPVGADYTGMVNCDHTNCEDVGCNDDDHKCLDCNYSKLTVGSLEQFLDFLRSAPIIEA